MTRPRLAAAGLPCPFSDFILNFHQGSPWLISIESHSGLYQLLAEEGCMDQDVRGTPRAAPSGDCWLWGSRQRYTSKCVSSPSGTFHAGWLISLEGSTHSQADHIKKTTQLTKQVWKSRHAPCGPHESPLVGQPGVSEAYLVAQAFLACATCQDSKEHFCLPWLQNCLVWFKSSSTSTLLNSINLQPPQHKEKRAALSGNQLECNHKTDCSRLARDSS